MRRCWCFPRLEGRACRNSILSLMQMAKTQCGPGQTESGRDSLYFGGLTDPTTGGVTASFAMLGDLNIAEPRRADRLCRASRY